MSYEGLLKAEEGVIIIIEIWIDNLGGVKDRRVEGPRALGLNLGDQTFYMRESRQEIEYSRSEITVPSSVCSLRLNSSLTNLRNKKFRGGGRG